MKAREGYLIGLDIGTTNTKAVAFDPARRRVVAVSAHPTPYSTGGDDRPSEIDPEALWLGVTRVLREVTAASAGPAAAVGIASMAEAGVPLDERGRPLYRIIPWYDVRTEPQLQRVLREHDPIRLFRITGQAPRHVYTLYKILWLREHAPDVFRSLHRWLSISDYVAWRLAGVAATDYSLASRTMFFDQRTRSWSAEMLAIAGLRADQLPEARPAGTIVGTVTAEAAAATGLPAGLPVAIGGHDHLCGAVGAGAIEPGQVVDSIGTAEGMVIPTTAYRDDDLFRQKRICIYAHVLADQYIVQAGMALSGGALSWIADRLFADAPDPVAAALTAAATAPAGAERLLYFPYLGGNGSPVGDENVAGAFIGLRALHERSHLVRAVLEGVAFAVRHSLEVVEQVIGRVPDPIRVIGGGGRSPLWLQIRADVLGRVLLGVEVPEAVALGAALLAGVGAGVFPDVPTAAAAVDRAVTAYEPDPTRHALYDRRFHDSYLQLYPALAPIFTALASEESVTLPAAGA